MLMDSHLGRQGEKKKKTRRCEVYPVVQNDVEKGNSGKEDSRRSNGGAVILNRVLTDVCIEKMTSKPGRNHKVARHPCWGPLSVKSELEISDNAIDSAMGLWWFE